MTSIFQIWRYKDVRKRILITVSLLIVFRLLSHIPLPGLSVQNLKDFFNQNAILGLLDLFSGGSIARFSLVMMGVGPYITASIIMQLLTLVVPSLEILSKEGEYGYKKINQYTRILTVPLAVFESYGLLLLLKNQQILPASSLTPFVILLILFASTAGTLLLMWLGEIISESGIGNGISLIIAAGIVAGVPGNIAGIIATRINSSDIIKFIEMGILFIGAIAAVVVVNEGQRNIPVEYAKRVRGRDTLGGVSTHLPLRILTAGVIPIIFAISLLTFPTVIAKFFEQARSPLIGSIAHFISRNLNPDGAIYAILYFLFVMAFTYFYTAVVFNPIKVAENIQKQGGFIPGIRPGRQTAEYLSGVMNRVTIVGAIFLGLIAVLPFMIQRVTGIGTVAIGGTGLLIIVSVAIETLKQFQSLILTRQYETY